MSYSWTTITNFSISSKGSKAQSVLSVKGLFVYTILSVVPVLLLMHMHKLIPICNSIDTARGSPSSVAFLFSLGCCVLIFFLHAPTDIIRATSFPMEEISLSSLLAKAFPKDSDLDSDLDRSTYCLSCLLSGRRLIASPTWMNDRELLSSSLWPTTARRSKAFLLQWAIFCCPLPYCSLTLWTDVSPYAHVLILILNRNHMILLRDWIFLRGQQQIYKITTIWISSIQ